MNEICTDADCGKDASHLMVQRVRAQSVNYEMNDYSAPHQLTPFICRNKSVGDHWARLQSIFEVHDVNFCLKSLTRNVRGVCVNEQSQIQVFTGFVSHKSQCRKKNELCSNICARIEMILQL